MPNNNPAGSNAYGSGGVEEAYGAIERRKVLTRLAPPPGNQQVAQALNAPKRLQKQQAKGSSPVTSNGVIPPPTPPPPIPSVAPLTLFWRSLALEAGASDLVKFYAGQLGWTEGPPPPPGSPDTWDEYTGWEVPSTVSGTDRGGSDRSGDPDEPAVQRPGDQDEVRERIEKEMGDRRNNKKAKTKKKYRHVA